MWPHTREARHRLALYLTVLQTPPTDPTHLIDLCSTGWTAAIKDGFATIGTVMFDASLGWATPPAASVSIAADQLVQFALHVGWVGFFPQPMVCANFIQSRYLAHPTSPFWQNLYGAIAWLQTPPTAVIDVFLVGRPDLQEMCRLMYGEWLCRVRTPQLIAVACEILLSAPWEFLTHSAVWQTVSDLLVRNGALMVALKSNERTAVTTVRSTTIDTPSIVLNGYPALVVPDRDMLLVAMQLMFCEPTGWSHTGLPADAPAVFAAVRTAVPSLFDGAIAPPTIPFDDLFFLDTDYKASCLA
jgi:hypothetical protein